MTVKELKEELKNYNPDLQVVVRGYENGYNDISAVKTFLIEKNVNSNWYDGEYIESNFTNSIVAVELFGENKNSKI